MAFENPLHNFSSHSYHHILVACNTTAVAESLSTSSATFSKLINTPGAANILGDDNATMEAAKTEDGEYVVIINGLSDAEFIVRAVNWSTIIAPGGNPTTDEQSTTMSIEGTMEIVEPKGFLFMNVVFNTSRVLNTEPVNIIWVLKTIFVGYGDTISSAPAYITNIKPLLFQLVDVEGSFDEGGSLYNLVFVAMINGAGKNTDLHPAQLRTMHVSSPAGVGTVLAPRTVNTSIDPNDPESEISKEEMTASTGRPPLTDAMYKLFDELNTAYAADIQNQKKQNHNVTGNLIQYDIQLDAEYHNYTIGPANENGSASGAGITYNFDSKSIENMIDQIMKSSPEVANDNRGNPRYSYKIHNTVINLKDRMVIKYTVTRFQVAETTDMGGQDLIQGVSRNVTPNNFNSQSQITPSEFNSIEFDYLYTGQNLDVKAFELKMTQGLSFFQLLYIQGNAAVSQNTVASDPTQTSEVPNPMISTALGSNIFNTPSPLIVPSKQIAVSPTSPVMDPVRNTSYIESINKQAALETLSCKLQIVGNPYLLDNMNTLPSEISGKSKSENNIGLSNWFNTPSLCKVNISMPSNNSLLGVGGQDTTFQTKFWYQGYYTILAIHHTFVDGIFTQDLDMISVPTSISAGTPDIPQVSTGEQS
jgi:hypothetical protein